VLELTVTCLQDALRQISTWMAPNLLTLLKRNLCNWTHTTSSPNKYLFITMPVTTLLGILVLLQGSLETLFRWDGKPLYDFVANIFNKNCVTNLISFIEDITKHFGLFFSGHGVVSWHQVLWSPAAIRPKECVIGSAMSAAKKWP